MRKINFYDKKLKTLLREREDIFKNVQKINEVIVAKDKERTVEGFKMDKAKNKITDILAAKNISLGEFEVWGRVFLEKGEPVLEIIDRVEEYKQMIRDEKKSKEMASDIKEIIEKK
jgi:hypothetical protein